MHVHGDENIRLASSRRIGERLKLKRVYETESHSEDGTRFLVERLWPRGVRKEALKYDEWLKDAAPSTALRKWFNHDPAKWAEFNRRYFAELDQQPDAIKPIREALSRGNVTLLFSAHDIEQNNAVALRAYVMAHR